VTCNKHISVLLHFCKFVSFGSSIDYLIAMTKIKPELRWLTFPCFLTLSLDLKCLNTFLSVWFVKLFVSYHCSLYSVWLLSLLNQSCSFFSFTNDTVVIFTSAYYSLHPIYFMIKFIIWSSLLVNIWKFNESISLS